MSCNVRKNFWYVSLIIIFVCYIDYTSNAVLSNTDLKKYKDLIEGQGLYSQQDDVLILTVFNFKNELYGKKHAMLVQFYNSWCGFCQRFAPTWKALAVDIKEWRNLVTVAAIDCSNDDNSQSCLNFEISSYPTIRYFHENYKEGSENFGVSVDKGEDIYSQKKKLIQRVVQEQKENRAAQFPNLQPVTSTDAKNLHPASGTTFTFLVLDNSTTTIGPELAIDLRTVSNITVKYAQNNTDLVSSMHVKQLPALAVIDSFSRIELLKENLANKEMARNQIKERASLFNIPIPTPTPQQDIFTDKWADGVIPDMSELIEARAREILRQKLKKMGDVIFQADLETALRHSLKHDVATVKTISGERLKALTNYVSVLVKYFPFGYYGREFLLDLKNKILEAGDTLQGSSVDFWIRDAESEDRKIFSSPAQWIGCQGSAKKYRGYPCGLWKLFHYLTVSAAEHNSGNGDAYPREVLDAMHGFIKNFFGCSDCSRHFQEMAAKKDMEGVSSLDTSILWLWMGHNEVNQRLSKDATEDPEFPKIQFPVHERCPLCRTNNTWNLQEVLTYLKQIYSSINVRYIGSDTRILHLGLEGPPGNGSPLFMFKNVDSSMCLILYVVCFVLLILLIRMFLKRGYKKKMYVHDLLGKV